jgi:hypothetical protein
MRERRQKPTKATLKNINIIECTFCILCDFHHLKTVRCLIIMHKLNMFCIGILMKTEDCITGSPGMQVNKPQYLFVSILNYITL